MAQCQELINDTELFCKTITLVSLVSCQSIALNCQILTTQVVTSATYSLFMYAKQQLLPYHYNALIYSYMHINYLIFNGHH